MHESTTRIEGQPIQAGISYVEYLKSRYLRERQGDFTDTTLSAKIGATASDTLLLLPASISHMVVQSDTGNKQVSLTDIRELGVGREKNRSGVKFGQLHISDDDHAPISELVAVKYTHRLTAPRELHAANTINRRFGDQVTFAPVGFIKSPTGSSGYITKYDHKVTSLDNILWNPTATEQQREHAMGFAGLWMASLHNHDIIHGDAQAKNIAYDASRMPRYVDLEGASDMHYGTLDTTTKRLLDIRDLFNPTYMPETTPDEEAIFVDSYLSHQNKRPDKLSGEDIIDTVRSAQEQPY